MNNLHSVCDNKRMDKDMGTANRNRGYEVYGKGKSLREQHIDLAFDKVREELLDDLFEAESQNEVYDILVNSLWNIINQYNLSIEPDDVLPFFLEELRTKGLKCVSQ